ncbi:MAG TPA: hypothetical protein VLB27_09845 [candidate division Zixibacteria bacterium]|nr:hypothetical protein [candidate division Zixibacteria bacterium]
MKRTAAAAIFVFWLGYGIVSTYAQPIIGGFVEGTQAVRVDKNPALGDGALDERSYPRSEVRAQLTGRHSGDREDLFIRVDVVSDATSTVETDVDLREAYVKLRLADWLDVKAGRQVATWGTGDLIFANDLFAKDWLAFFTGMDIAYLKPPQDLLRVSMYTHGVTIEAAASPHFTPDNLPGGTRLSVFNPFLRQTVAADQAPEIAVPSKRLANGEVFGRIAGYQGSAEWALYGYRGFWPTPQGATMAGMLYYPRLWSAGASWRMPVGAILFHAEGAAYISEDDDNGTNPLIANSQLRGFVGAQRSLGREWTASVQYYAEFMLDHDAYLASLPSGAPAFDEVRSTVTGRLGKWMRQQTVYLSVFGYWGVTDEDWHLRPSVSYKVTDAVNWTVGASLVDGDQPHTMFGQFRDNSNVYTRLRFSF